MSRRTTPQQKTDDAAFPVRIYLRIPGEGFGLSLDALYQWLAVNAGRGAFAIQAGGRQPGADSIMDRLAIYLRHPKTAAALLEAFPDLHLADGTKAITYTSPL